MKNLGLKLFSLGVAALLWYYVHSEGNAIVRTFVSAVEIRGVPEGRMILGSQNPHAQVTIRGPAYIVSRIPAAPPVFTLMVPQTVGDKLSVALDPASLTLPANVEVLNIDPPQIHLLLDKRKEKSVAVAVPKNHRLDSDLKLDLMTITPERITLTGPESELNSINNVETEALNLGDVTQSASYELPIRAVGTQVQMSSTRAKVSLEVSPIVVSRQFDKIPLEVRALSGLKFFAVPSQVDITLEGPRRTIEKLATKDVVAYVRVPEGAGTATDAPVSVDLAPNVTLKSVSPKTVNLKAVTEIVKNATAKNVVKSPPKPKKK